jgi:hypothetical protein
MQNPAWRVPRLGTRLQQRRIIQICQREVKDHELDHKLLWQENPRLIWFVSALSYLARNFQVKASSRCQGLKFPLEADAWLSSGVPHN